MNDVMFSFSHTGANGPESNTTRMFRRVRQMTPPGRSCYLRLQACVSREFSGRFSDWASQDLKKGTRE